MEKLKSQPLKSEINPENINLFHEGITKEINHSCVEYQIKGTIFSINTNTRLELEKKFSELSDAEIYFEKIIKEFPKSEIILKSIEIKEMKLYV